MQSINLVGVYTLYKREVWRFLKVWNQTVTAPMVTTLLFLAILTLALGGSRRTVGDMPFDQFIAPGLIMMAVVQNAFANTSSSLMLQKIQGVIIDLLMPPLSGAEITFSMVMGGVSRGILVGISVSVAMALFVDIEMHSWSLAVFYLLASSIMLALLGLLTGIWAQTFDQLAAITNYVVTPLSFLSGTFYSIQMLPGFWYHISHANPFFYMIDGFRYALTGFSDAPPETGMIVLIGTNIVLWTIAQYVLKKGYRLKT
ncbi:MAG: multidrug ABC transporter permease [Rickettsiales bacterium]|nr:multidrug ABC transporter permease [Rickettsiales bacterium]|tara:strand:- start:276 stop:1046 length:771 start_codon:yes stop_codon:yes gene_type:complete